MSSLCAKSEDRNEHGWMLCKGRAEAMQQHSATAHGRQERRDTWVSGQQNGCDSRNYGKLVSKGRTKGGLNSGYGANMIRAPSQAWEGLPGPGTVIVFGLD